MRNDLDDPSAKLWTDASLDMKIQLSLDDLYGDILDTAPYIVSMYQQIGLPLRTPGYILLDLSTNGGDLTQRFYRLQQLIADGRQYFAKDPRDFLMTASSQTNDITTIKANQGVEQRFSYQFLGNQLWLHPLGQVTTFVEIRYNYKPTPFTSLTSGYVIPLPEGSEHYAVQFCAAMAMMKGNREDATQLLVSANMAKDRMINSIRRQYHGMTVPFTVQNPWEWGGA